ncbi:hypothetical protein D3C85_1660750 [compost metagenome]
MAATYREFSRLICPSERSSASGICDPVTITGLPRFSSMNDSAEAVNAIVSVPCRITKPSYSS